MGADEIVTLALARVGTTLRDKWCLESLLGVGGMAAVYAGRHRNGMRGAVKVLHRDLSGHSSIRSRFLREGYVANRIEHPGVVRVLDDDVTEDGSAFLVMELLTGQTVEARAKSSPGLRIGADDVLRIADDLLDVLAVAHVAGVIHRDLKPENLFLTEEGQLKVLDFGIAKLREANDGEAITRTGHMLGTPEFMPPEQASGLSDATDARTDLWAVGAVMFTLLTGRRVHEGETVQLVLMRAMSKPAPGLGEIAPQLGQELCRVVDRSLAFSPEDRYPDAQSMQRAVRSLRGSERVDPTGATQADVKAPAKGSTAAAEPVEDPPVAALSGVHAPTRRPSWQSPAGLVGLGILVVGGVALAYSRTVARGEPDAAGSGVASAPMPTASAAPTVAETTSPNAESSSVRGEPNAPVPFSSTSPRAPSSSRSGVTRPIPSATASAAASAAPGPTTDPYDRRR